MLGEALAAESEAGFGLKAREWNSRALLREWRQRWAELANARLCEQGQDLWIDHRSNAARGIALEPQNKIGPAGARRAQRVERARWAEEAERAAEHAAIARRNGERIAADPSVALDALTRQQSTFTRADLGRFIHRHTDGAEQFAQVLAVVEASAELVRLGQDGRGRLRFTTREMLRVERQMEQAAAALSVRTTHAVALDVRRRAMAAPGLEEEQRAALGHVTRARDLTVLLGIAGGGKTALLGEARAAWELQGYRVRGAALSGIAAEGLEAGSGIASRTLASLEWGWQQERTGERLTARDVLVVDEAGMIGSRQMARVLGQARAAGAKVVLVGDPEQLQAIEAGAAFRAIAERVGAAEIRQTLRQHAAWQREATRELATGRTAAALARYEAAGMVHGHGTHDQARAGVVELWEAERRQAPEQSRIILTSTRADAAALNGLARERLRAAGALGPDVAVSTERGERLLAAGDRVMFLRNDRGLGVKNGTLGTVARVAAGGGWLVVRLDGREGARAGRVVGFTLGEYAHIEHGYAATVHKGQGVTVDRAHVLASRPMDRHAAYVALTRHREGVALHWGADEMGGRAGLSARLGRERLKDTSLDYEAGPDGGEALVRRYAARRGLDPLRPVSEIVVRTEEQPAAPIRDPEEVAETTPPKRETLSEATRRILVGEAGPETASVPPLEPWPGGGELEAMLRAAAAASVQRKAAPPVPVPSLLPAHRAGRGLDSLGRGTSAAEIAAAVEGDPAVQRARGELRRLLEAAYREPDAAVQVLAAVEQREGGAEGAARELARRGPALLGRLRGRAGWFASETARAAQVAAGRAAAEIGPTLVRVRGIEAEAPGRYTAAVEAQRALDRVAVPGLSARATAAIAALQAAGAVASWRPPPPWEPEPDAGERQRMASASRAWRAVRAEPALAAELDRFAAAAEGRLGTAGVDAVRRSAVWDNTPFRVPGIGPTQQGALDTVATALLVVRHARALHGTQQVYQQREAKRAAEAARAAAERARWETEAPLRRVRERLVKERMAAWWQEANLSSWIYERPAVTEARAARGRKAQAQYETEVAAMPAAELVRIGAAWDRQEAEQAAKQAKTRQAAQRRPKPRPSPGPSPS